ncbi:MAG TPA: LPS assembly lipoprotein LptE [Burkholderiales bacterium]|jgi:LPS-assembly lipoprotein
MSRFDWLPTLRRAFLCGLLFSLAGCGFQLRGEAQLPFDTMYIDMPQTNAVGAQLARQLRASSNAKIVDNRTEAQVILTRAYELRSKTILSINSAGRVREFRLRYTFNYSLVDQKGQNVVPPVSISLERDYAYSDDQVLAKESEEQLLYRDMQTDLVQQIIRRLAATHPGAASTGPATNSTPISPGM